MKIEIKDVQGVKELPEDMKAAAIDRKKAFASKERAEIKKSAPKTKKVVAKAPEPVTERAKVVAKVKKVVAKVRKIIKSDTPYSVGVDKALGNGKMSQSKNLLQSRTKAKESKHKKRSRK